MMCSTQWDQASSFNLDEDLFFDSLTTLGVVISEPLGTIPWYIAQKVNEGAFIDLRLVYPPNANKVPTYEVFGVELDMVLLDMQPISSIDVWMEAFMAYTSLVALSNSSKVRDLLGYALLVKYAHRTGHSSGWMEYDLMFRLVIILKLY